MRLWRQHFGAACLVLILAVGTSPVSAEDVTVSFASLGAAYMDHLVAIERGYMAEEGLSVKIIRSGGGSATQTLLSGQL
ncbi:MAG TPA: ABC transporter substrate-binding protein, partial [Candidatus Limnocylindrales bacterium]|nr:ABC transporter substrate-binding protein [Candidatus Limnocylindrales bacterium]